MKFFGCNKFFLATVATATTIVQGTKDDSIVSHSNVRGGIPSVKNNLEGSLMVGVGANQSRSTTNGRDLQSCTPPDADYNYVEEETCGSAAGIGSVDISTSDICNGAARLDDFTVSTGSGDKSPLEFSNPDCCAFGFDSGIKIYNSGCGDNASFPNEDTFCTESGLAIFARCEDAAQLTVTFPVGFMTKNNEVMVFRKAGSGSATKPFPSPYIQCGVLNPSAPTTLSFDNGESLLADGTENPAYVDGAKGTSHVDICWNAPESTPGEVCDEKDTDCADYSYDPNHPDADEDGCYLVGNNDCLEVPPCQTDDTCPTKDADTCKEWVCAAPNTPGVDADGCLLTNQISTTCSFGDCGQGTCSSGVCTAVIPKDGLCPEAPECQKSGCVAEAGTYACRIENDDSMSCGDPNDCTTWSCQAGICTEGDSKADGVPCATGGCCAAGICGTSCPTCDCDPPMLSGLPEDGLTFECGSILPTYTVAASPCEGAAPGVKVETTQEEPGCSWEVTSTWSAENCGGSRSDSRTFTVTDSTGPIIIVAPAIQQCDEDLVEPTFSDCTGVDETTLTHTVTGSEPSYCRMETVSWTVEDVCGNKSTETQSVTRTKPHPKLVVPDDLEVNCALAGKEAFINKNKPVVEDICDAAEDAIVTQKGEDVLVVDAAPENCRAFVRTWEATDLCGQKSNTVQQTISIFDLEAPQAKPLDSLTFSCLGDVPAPPVPEVSDNCQATIDPGTPTETKTPFAAFASNDKCKHKLDITRVWNFADDCGNPSSARQIITVNDSDGPDVATFSSVGEIQCPNSDIPAVTITDACDGGDVSQSIEKTTLIPKTTSTGCLLSVDWIFLDQCENESKKEHTLTVLDTEPPALPLDDIGPPELNFKCGENTAAPLVGDAVDGCDGNVAIDAPVDGTKDFQSIPGFVFTRTWSVQDQCGNVNTFPQTIYVYDYCEFPVSEAFSGVNIGVTVSIENKVGGGVIFTITVDDGMLGDLRGFFFRLVDGVSITEDDITGDVNILTAKVVDLEHDLIRISNDVTMQGDGNQNRFTAGVAIGRQGLRGGSDDYQTFTFEVAGISTDDIEGNVGIRLTSVTDANGGREESSKIIGAVVCCRSDSTVDPSPPPPSCVASEETCCPTADEGCDCSAITCPEPPVECPAACVCGDGTAACAADRRGLSGMLW